MSLLPSLWQGGR